MDNFTFYSPTKFVFGKDTEKNAGALVKEFGGSKVTRATAQSSKPSSSLEATRRAVEATKRERERQKEIDKKRKSKMG